MDGWKPSVTVRTHEDAAALAGALRSRSYQVQENDHELQVEYSSPDIYDAIRDAAVETHSALVLLKRRVLSLEDIYLDSQVAANADSSEAL